jgi:hypothetical protein
MAGGPQQQPPASGGHNPGVDEDVGSQGDEGRRSASATPPIADDAEHDQTQVPSPDDDVGVPPLDERPEEEE